MAFSGPTFPFDWVPDAILVTAPDGTIVHANPRAEDLFGYTRSEVVDRPLEMLIPEGAPRGADREAPLQQLSRPVVCAHRDGTRFSGALRWRPASAEGGSLLVFSVREHGTAEAPRGGADPAELFALFAHDVRQSLQSVQFLCDSIASRSPEEAATISEIVDSIGKLLDRLTRFGDPAGIRPVPERCRLGELLGTLQRELLPVAERKGLRLAIDEHVGEITTDPILFRELLHNLVANAIRYTYSGHVEVRCRAIEGTVRIDVVDTGVGLDGDQLDAILRGASDVPGANRASPGVGLAIVQRLARVLGCRLEVDSAPGRGSCFTVTAPRGGGSHGPDE